MVDAQYICCINDSISVFLILNAIVLIIKVGHITYRNLETSEKEKKRIKKLHDY